MTTAYRSAERELLRGFALQTITDPKSTPDERATAARRLLDDDGREPDFELLTLDELHAFREAGHVMRALFAKARGEAPTRREPTPPPVMSVEFNPPPVTPAPDLAATDATWLGNAIARARAQLAPTPQTLDELLDGI